MNIFVEGEYVESVLYIAQRNAERGRKTALVAGSVELLPFDFETLDRKKIDFKGVDVYISQRNFDEKDYNMVIYYNCEDKAAVKPNHNDICLWIIQQGAVAGTDPFVHYCCRKKMVVRNYTEHPMFDAVLSRYEEYEIYCIPYTQEDHVENINLQMLGTWDYSNLSDKYKEFLSDFFQRNRG